MKAPKQFQKLAKRLFPDYKGRKFFVEYSDQVTVSGRFWDGGSRTYWKALDLRSAREMDIPGINPLNPNQEFFPRVTLVPGLCLVSRSIFLGKETGITFHLPLENQVTAA